MLDEAEVISVVRDLWARHRDELPIHDRAYGYVRGKMGVPEVPDGAGDELQDIAKMSVKNVLGLVRNAFCDPLSVVGFRSPVDTENNSAVWALWQRQKLDARQAEAYRAAVTYGTAYAVVLREGIHFRSPRQMFAVYADAHVDDFPVYALETWIDRSGRKPVRKGRLFDETHIYPVSLGTMSKHQDAAEQTRSAQRRMTLTIEEDPEEHGLDHTPVIRFLNTRDAEDLVEGEIAPLINDQRAINAVNFDRLTVSRHGAFAQKYVIGWAPSTSAELVKASVQRLMAFDDPEVKVGNFAPSSVDGYNSILVEMLVHVAMEAGIAPFGITGSFANLGADAIAQIAKPYQDKLGAKQSSFGESVELMLRDFARLNGVEVPEGAEVVWAETEARSFAQVVDGIVKLTSAEVPIEVMLEDVPGWTQQRVDAARAAIRKASGGGVLDALRGAAGDTATVVVEDAAGVKAKADALGALIRAGAEPKSAAAMIGLTGLEFTGAVPAPLRLPSSEADALEDA